MKLYNTLTRQVEEIKPLQPGVLSVYTCGPTVYDYAHIGHWFNYVRMDMLIRTIKLSGFKPNWVMNITDVGHLVSDADDGEDKLQKGARREGKTAWEVAETFTADFIEGMQLLNITKPDYMPRATDHITEQIELIQMLEKKGFAYVIEDGVYYDTSKFSGYAAFALLDLDAQTAGARVSFNQQKRNLADFALWKFSPPTEQRDMEWDSPWGKGFPGWHIECSAMSMKYLGPTIDIHSGGIDHVAVHHTNEIAQSEAVTGTRFANYWLHSNHITLNGEKISKSLGNGIRIQEIIAKGIPAQAVRLHILESHYRSQSKFSWESLEAAHNRLKNYQAFAALQYQTVAYDERLPLRAGELTVAKSIIITALQDDLKTSDALVELSQISEQAILRNVASDVVQEFIAFLQFIDNALGLELATISDITVAQKQLIVDRQQARDSANWALSDNFRDQLLQQGIGLRDTPHGAIWFWQ